jgi:hypothetical protein
LTIKFTRHTEQLRLTHSNNLHCHPERALSFAEANEKSSRRTPTPTSLLECGFLNSHHHPTRLRKLYGPRSCSSRAKRLYVSAPQQVFSQALIKIYSLVDCPIYSVVKYRPRQLSLAARLSGYEQRTESQ